MALSENDYWKRLTEKISAPVKSIVHDRNAVVGRILNGELRQALKADIAFYVDRRLAGIAAPSWVTPEAAKKKPKWSLADYQRSISVNGKRTYEGNLRIEALVKELAKQTLTAAQVQTIVDAAVAKALAEDAPDGNDNPAPEPGDLPTDPIKEQ